MSDRPYKSLQMQREWKKVAEHLINEAHSTDEVREAIVAAARKDWNTKGETLAKYIAVTGDSSSWANTRSCWQQNRNVGVKGETRQCGVCAACMLRRFGVHAAEQVEPASTYVWEDLSAPHFKAGASPDFDKAKISYAMRQHAIAGTLHADHLAALPGSQAHAPRVSVESFWLGQALEMRKDFVEQRIERLLAQHKTEWEKSKATLGSGSFVKDWMIPEVRS